MAAKSSMLGLGTTAPDFELPATTGDRISLATLQDEPALLVTFICNHCPYVKHVRGALTSFGHEFKDKGLGIVAINSNDASAYPADSPEKMREEVAAVGYPFPYLFDGSQSVAKAYSAACTPDLFLFDHDRRLVYRGQFDDSRPGNRIPVSGQDLRRAVEALLAGDPIPSDQKASVGCSIKWRPGNEPE